MCSIVCSIDTHLVGMVKTVKTQEAPKGATRRVRFVVDDEYVFDKDEYPQTPEDYEGVEFCKDGQPIPFDEYIRTIGNLDNHRAFWCEYQTRCTCCNHWHKVDIIGILDMMYGDHMPNTERYYYPEDLDVLHDDARGMAKEFFDGLETPNHV
jgi:hypothetical protein